MVKKMLTIIMIAVMALSLITSVSAASITVKVDGKTIALDVAPVIESGRTLVPIRAIAEALGADVQWDDATKTATVTTVDKEVSVTVNKSSASVNGEAKTLDVAAKIIGGRTMLPLRFVGEALGAKVDYIDATKTVTVDYFTDMSGTIKITGSTSVQPIFQSAADKLMAMNKGLSVTVAGGGSSVGLKDVASGSSNIGGYSTELSSSDRTTYPDVVDTKIAMDGIAIITHPSNPVSNLTKQQIFDIYTGKITNWKDVGGEDAAIFVQQREATSGTNKAFKELLLDSIDKTKKATVVSTATPHASSGLILQAVASNKNAIGYESFGYLNSTVKTPTIEGVSATKANALSGKFPIVRPLNVLTKGSPSGLNARFINYILSPEGQKIVNDLGYVPLKIKE
ncbi:MAG: phosphate ABC transporter substrate-binding protein PstS family protein [Clostridia bacterium]|nr:phosphate ABC transporter substrate-binding protein PstS family protein [Clostridia bacterium]